MFRFRSHCTSRTSGFPVLVASTRGQRWRIWMLLMALGLVVVAMRQLGKTDSAVQLGVLFSNSSVTDVPAAQAPVSGIEPTALATQELGVGETIRLDSNSLALSAGDYETGPEPFPHPQLPVADRVPGLSRVKDKTYFRPAEQEAWLNLLARLQKAQAEGLVEALAAEVTYAQLLKQPDVYRGHRVTIRGTVLREEIQRLGENSLGIEVYHRIWIRPRGGGNSPFVVYCLRLPQEFPRGDGLRSPVTVTGYFFKNWSFSWEQGLALAPTVLASSFSWAGPGGSESAASAPWTNSWERSPGTVVLAVVGVCAVGLVFAWVAIRSTARRPSVFEQSGAGLRLPDDWAVPDSVQHSFAPSAKDERR
ncbi:MAG: hypothetical protein MK171_09615 [Pirellulales bacterium]|nr:hypothetical protein [Pirellulales bacterium]